MASILSFTFRLHWVKVAVLCVALLASAAVYADPTNCDDDMTEDQRFQAELCSSHAGCRLVFGIADSCIKVKSFLSKLGLGSKGSATRVTDDQVSYALVESGVPQSGISSCLHDFDLAKCKEYFSGGPKQPSSKNQADDIVQSLNSPIYNATKYNSTDGGSIFGRAKLGLEKCDDATNEAKMRDAARAKEWCRIAENAVQSCLSTKGSHDELRKKLQSLIDNGGLGADAASYRSLANTPYPECPATLPSSGKTPNAALADYLKFWDAPEEGNKEAQRAEEEGKADRVIARCDAMRRDISDAVDNNELDRTSGLIDQFETACSRVHGTYLGLAGLYKQRLAAARTSAKDEASMTKEDEPAVALPRRGSSSGSTMFQQAISQAEQDAKDPSARVARERRAAEQEKIESEQAAKAQEQSSQAAWDVLGKLGKAAIAAAGGQSSAEQMQLALNSLAQGEEEKSASGSAATDGAVGETNAVAQVSSTGSAQDCQTALNSLVGPINDTTALSKFAPAQWAQQSVWAAQTYLRVANTLPACANDPQSRKKVADTLQEAQRRCRSTAGAYNCESGQNFSGTAARTEVAIRQLFQEMAAGGSNAIAKSSSGDCQAAYDRQEVEFTAINQRRNPNIRGVLPDLQVALYMTSQRMAMLDKLCKGQPQYAEYASMKLGYDRAMQACRQSVTNSAYCVPKVAW